MGHYLQKVRAIELLQMKCEFQEDENKNIWFTFASDIQYRDTKFKAIDGMNPKDLQCDLKKQQDQQKLLLLDELKEQEEAMNETAKENAVRKEMYKFMSEYYSEMRAEMHLDENQAQDEEEPKLEQVLRTLKPNTTAMNFKEHLKPSQNFSKS